MEKTDPAFPRHDQVQRDEIGGVPAQYIGRFPPVASRHHPEAMVFEDRLQKENDIRFVVHDQNGH
jgi:hypothetical protein